MKVLDGDQPPVLTACCGTNEDLFPRILDLYVPDGALVADVTYGRGCFWKQVDTSRYRLFASDKTPVDGYTQQADCTRLPYAEDQFDAVVFDPPYMHGGKTVKPSINKCYRNENGSHASVIRLYAAGLLGAARVLHKGGVVIVKTQDEIESGRQRFSHVEVLNLLVLFGFEVVDLFVLVQTTTPALRENYQKTARKNHSYFLVGRLKA